LLPMCASVAWSCVSGRVHPTGRVGPCRRGICCGPSGWDVMFDAGQGSLDNQCVAFRSSPNTATAWAITGTRSETTLGDVPLCCGSWSGSFWLGPALVAARPVPTARSRFQPHLRQPVAQRAAGPMLVLFDQSALAQVVGNATRQPSAVA
jgi:hypothetical protein